MKEISRRAEIIGMNPGDVKYYPLESVASVRSQIQELYNIYTDRNYTVERNREIEKCIVKRNK